MRHRVTFPGATTIQGWCRRARCAGTLLLIVLMCSGGSSAYSVLTHEEIVDLLWTDEIRPLLLKRYPGLSEDQITEAHAYAYGGAVIQDLGYYPFGSREFSNLVHYVRSGDFVRELLLESQDVNEYAFALGALSHYASDIAGHPAVNQAVAIEYPKLRAKFGKSVRYAQDKTAHLKTEFGFDMVQVAKNRYASQQYHDFIGFQVSKSLLERVFPVVYGVELKDVLAHEDLAVGSYRYSVSRLIPQMTQVALQTHKKDLMRETPNFAKQKFLYRLSRSDYEKEWGKDYVKPGFGTRILSTLLRYMPKIGPFKGLAFNNPTPKPKICISRASIRPSTSTGFFWKRCARTRWCCPIVILIGASDQGRGILAYRRHLREVAGSSCQSESSIERRPSCATTSWSFTPTSLRRSRPRRTKVSWQGRADCARPVKVRAAGSHHGGPAVHSDSPVRIATPLPLRVVAIIAFGRTDLAQSVSGESGRPRR